MRYIKSLLLIVILFMFVSIINVDAAGVSIKSIRLVEGDAIEVSEPKINGLNINFDLSFSSLGDNAIYEVVLNNPTNYEYEINTEKKFGPSNYISYSYELKDKTNRIKAKSEVVLYITISYDNPVPADKLVNGKYIENNDMGINLLNESNPDTFNNILFIILMITMLVIATLVFKFTKNKGLYIVMLSLLLVPITVFALEKLKLTVSTKITIDENYRVYYVVPGLIPKSELNKENYSYEECNDVWFMDGDNHEEYVYCDGLYKKDRNLYKPGDRVNTVNSVSYYEVDNWDNCDEETDKVVCPIVELKDNHYSCMNFSCGIEHIKHSLDNYDGFICTEEEFNNMNFGSVDSSYWEDDYGSVLFRGPNSFTMPRHDVYISRGDGCDL